MHRVSAFRMKAVLSRAVVQPHPDKAQVVADRAVKAVAAHMHLRLGRQFEIHWRERAVGTFRMDPGEPLPHRIRQLEGHVLDSDRFEYARLEDVTEPLIRDGLDDLTAPVEIGAAIPSLARISLPSSSLTAPSRSALVRK